MHTILIVEDDSTIHMMMHEYLEKRGFRCEDAYSGTEALLHIRQACPDLILMDLMLPGADGSCRASYSITEKMQFILTCPGS